jgi:hypothetical protein
LTKIGCKNSEETFQDLRGDFVKNIQNSPLFLSKITD